MLRTLTLLLPALIPSWRFFDEIAPSPRIEFALLTHAQETPEHWREFRPRPQRLSLSQQLQRLFWNPHGNDALFLVSCAERLMEHPTEHSHQEILKRLRADFPAAAHIQFRLVFVSRHSDGIHRDVTYLSPIHGRAQS